jgi:predicted house-cleaning NTP pyrophosphatase (Maf/HAM1 superfamily)
MGIVNFKVLVSSFAEDFDKKSFQLSSEYCAATAQKKLEFVVSDYATQRTDLNKPVIIIAADTVVDVDNMTLEKPTDKDDSFRMIKMLSG